MSNFIQNSKFSNHIKTEGDQTFKTDDFSFKKIQKIKDQSFFFNNCNPRSTPKTKVELDPINNYRILHNKRNFSECNYLVSDQDVDQSSASNY